MSSSWFPVGYSHVSPYLVVSGASRTIEFLVQAFDATELRRFAREDGSVMHAEVQLGNSVIMLGDSSPEWPALPAFVHVYVPDVDVTYQRALAAGAESVQAPVQKGDEDKRGGVRDAGGTTWWIATRIDP